MASIDEEGHLREVYYLTNPETKNWRSLLKYGEDLNAEIRRKLLWIWPTEKSLWQFGKILREFNIGCLLSIGCGNGLFEWIIRESLNVEIYGLEVDRDWWCSNYAIKSFIELNYVDNMDVTKEEYLRTCCLRDSWNFALLFCYFNNRPAFLQYLKLYKGRWICIIGPLEKRNVYTDPLPLEPNFPVEDNVTTWKLKASLKMGENDIMAFYEKQID
ncbi:uncharacterized protein LOC133322080 [Musca vetustissima]|uniref:uncharacterized protein LOC133322080 n=1 Tax=Musca vetustissima TaxID=27455 RepID=UPI002AB5E7F2|nr:uncharacterized protein LOC133322080 [Musca vetustissima]